MVSPNLSTILLVCKIEEHFERFCSSPNVSTGAIVVAHVRSYLDIVGEISNSLPVKSSDAQQSTRKGSNSGASFTKYKDSH